MKRYQVQELNGKWYVVDLYHPDHPAPVYNRRQDAEHDARIWNLLVIQQERTQ